MLEVVFGLSVNTTTLVGFVAYNERTGSMQKLTGNRGVGFMGGYNGESADAALGVGNGVQFEAVELA